ncbi:MAG: Arginine N-succinyltransferase [Chlamydiales bacterium]|nr:Arginine N-succinyltransferase [Chlamydiales bacterium]MCH9620393.1 Arginine N-succinyltransferase [Chlamydiales bacterium]MCH9622961.1 Arginine N-succinyltransferase [Chlamydiales bacterium]
MLVIRRSRLEDLDSLLSFAHEATEGITSMPENRAFLEKSLELSEKGFETGLFLFSLEKDGEMIGVSGIASHTPNLFCYRLGQEPFTYKKRGIDQMVDLLFFHKKKSKPSELETLFLQKKYRDKGFGKLLSFCRFLFIATFRSSFSPVIMTRLRGLVDDNGHCPFWEGLGRKFYQIDFGKADRLYASDHAFVTDLFPRHPIYVDLLPPSTQAAIGKTHRETIAAQKLLEKEGFAITPHVNLLDGGPQLQASTRQVRAIKESRVLNVCEIVSSIDTPTPSLISNIREDFRATTAPLFYKKNRLTLSKEVAELLEVNIGDKVRVL